MPADAARGPRHAVWLWAAACVPPLIVYARTMAPGLVARGDTPKFQFLGVVLGTAHEPGYPLFVMLSWVFSHLPWGTVAWRVNAMTMLFAVLAAGLTAAAARRCGAPPVASVLAGLGLAFGPVFWAQATAAEVYTLAAVFQAAVLALLMRWSRSRRDRDLLATIGVAALALGHHPTFVMLTPALAAFVLITDWRVITRLRIMLPGALMAAAGLAQYAFVVIRTHQRAVYLEATALGARDLIQVLRGSQYSGSLFAFSIAELVDARIPLVSRILLGELGAPGLALSAVGLGSIIRSEWRAGLLLLCSAATIFVFACTYDVEDTPVFCIPIVVVLWILAARGLGAVASLTASATRLGAPLVSATVVAVMVTAAVARGFASADRSTETYEAAYLTSMFEQIDKPATIVVDYEDSRFQALAHALRYKFFVDRAGPGRVAAFDEVSDPLADPQQRRPVYAFDPAQWLLQPRGLTFAKVLVPIGGGRPAPGGPPLTLYRSIAVASCAERAAGQWAFIDQRQLIGQSLTVWARSENPRAPSHPPATMVMYVVSEEAPPSLHVEAGGAEIEVRAETIAAGDLARNADLAAVMRLEVTQARHRYASRFEYTIPAGAAEPTALVTIAPRPVAVVSRLTGAPGARVRVCASPVDGRVLFGDRSETAVEFLNAGGLLSNGWRQIESSATDRLRWTGTDRPGVHFTLAAPLSLLVSIDAAPLRTAPGDRLQLVVNGAALEAKALDAGRATYSWAVTAAMLHAGYNRMALMTPQPQSPRSLGLNDDERLLGLAIRSWLLTRSGSQ